MIFFVIGITDSDCQHFTDETLKIINNANIFSGGKRHHDLIRHLLPVSHRWIDVTVPLNTTLDMYKKENGTIVVFASGDPLFYGFAVTLKREFPAAELKVFPAFNSLQTLAHKFLLPYGEMLNVSLTGRPWTHLDEALIRNTRIIGVLTDNKKTPFAIARHLKEYGYDNYRLYLGENLGNKDTESVRCFSLDEVPHQTARLNCLILEQVVSRPVPFGLRESDFDLLDGRVNMITKMPVRLATLAQLSLHDKQCLWDIGFCTGSVSIEARLRFPHLNIEAFEIRPECEMLLQSNSKRFGAPGINYHIGDFFNENLDTLPRPDAVFIGGHGGRLADMVTLVKKYIQSGGILVFNSVSDVSRDAFAACCQPVECHTLSLDNHNKITIMKWVS